MGSLNAMAHVMCASASDSPDALWDLAEELWDRLDGKIAGDGPLVHGFPADQRAKGVPRFCFHPTGEMHIEFRSNELRDAVQRGCVYLARLMPEHELWRRD